VNNIGWWLLKMDLSLDVRARNLVSAALRHARDAEYLLDTSHSGHSIDQAYHLAGFGPECIRKSTIALRCFDHVIGHQLGQRAEFLLDFIVGVDPWAARYHPKDWEVKFPALAAWSEQSRYEKTGNRTQAGVTEVVEQARHVVDEIYLALWMDGRIPGGVE